MRKIGHVMINKRRAAGPAGRTAACAGSAYAGAKKDLKKNALRFILSLAVTLVLAAGCFIIGANAAAGAPKITIDLAAGSGQDGAFGLLEMLFLLVLLALAPSLLVMMTSFTRIIIVLSFLRNALGTQQSPPNQVLIGLSLFLSLFIMYPTLAELNTQAYEPLKTSAITQEEAVDQAVLVMKRFMLKQIREPKDLSLFITIAKDKQGESAAVPDTQALIDAADGDYENLTQLGMEIVVPSYIISELRRAFEIGFLLFIPFLIIDITVSSTLMSMGMVMLPPSMIALPFKIMLFVLVDGWGLLFEALVKGFR